MVCESGSRLLAFVVTSMVIVGCTCSNDLTTPREVDPIATSGLRIVHASPDAPALTCWQNDKLMSGTVSAASPVGPQQTIPSEYRNLRLRDPEDQARLSSNIFLTPDKPFVFIAYDSVHRMRGMLLEASVPPTPDGRQAFRVMNADVALGPITVINGRDQIVVDVGLVSDWLETTDPSSLAIRRVGGLPVDLQPVLTRSIHGTLLIVRPILPARPDVVVVR